MRWSRGLKPYVQHLRLPFQLTLAPLFMWGYFLAKREPDTTGVIAFAALHLFLYPGVTAFNSAYDRDEGPVSGMLSPPPVPPGLLSLSLVLQLAGAVLASLVSLSFLLIYAAIAALAAAYSHPAIRLKAHPLKSAAVVALGQGGLGFLGGWTAGEGGFTGSGSLAGILGFMAAALTTLGLYPMTQVFQIDEDRARGDMTLAVMLGAPTALRFGAGCLLAAGVAAMALASFELGGLQAALTGLAYAITLAEHERFARHLAAHRPSRTDVYRRAMRMNLLATAGFLTFITCQVIADAIR